MKNDIMQCKPYTSFRMPKPCFGQVKMNGIFGRWDSESGKIFTRSGREILGLTHLREELAGLPDLDGELVIPGLDFFKMNGLIRSFNETPDCNFYVFDMPLKGVQTKNRLKKYTELILKHNALQSMIDWHIHPLKYFYLKNEEEMDHFYNRVIQKGHEGVVYKNYLSTYYKGKKWSVQKRVPEQTADCQIVGLVEGTKSFTGMLGAFVIDYKGNKVKVGGGQGMTHGMRLEVWNDPQKYLDNFIEVSFKGETAKGSLQSPKFMRFRWDL